MSIVLADDKALHPNAFLEKGRHQKRQAVWPVRQARRVVAAHQATHRHARGGVQQGQHGVKHFPADVFIVDINAVRAGLLELVGKIRRVVIQTLVKPEHLNGMAAFLCATGDADHPATFDFADLPNRRAHRAGRRRHHQRFTRFRLPDIQQPHIGGKARHTQYAQRPGRMRRILAQLHQAAAVREFIFLPAAVAQHPFTGFEVGMV
ncbi:Uncharacterised protein [Enterobacter roggenkampii]|nr:Uncharacterised protein [Enterobacter roggenkampii]